MSSTSMESWDAWVYGGFLCAQAASDVYSPVSGEVVEFNEKLVEEPGTVRYQARCVREWLRRDNNAVAAQQSLCCGVSGVAERVHPRKL